MYLESNKNDRKKGMGSSRNFLLLVDEPVVAYTKQLPADMPPPETTSSSGNLFDDLNSENMKWLTAAKNFLRKKH